MISMSLKVLIKNVLNFLCGVLFNEFLISFFWGENFLLFKYSMIGFYNNDKY